jgi:CRP-like cAMP-binding protein
MLPQAIQTISAQFSPLSKISISELVNCAHLLTYKKGYKLIHEGQFSDELFFILEGAAKAYYVKDGKLITDWFAFENEFICAINSFFLFIPSPHYIELLEDSTLVMIKRNDMMNLCDKHHDIERLGRISTTKTMLQLQQRVVSLQFETAHQRYLNLLAQYPKIEQRASLGDIASFLGITQETLSRIRASQKRI